MDVEAGRHVGDPVYLLAHGVSSGVQGVLYQSTDAGQSWQRLALGVLPSMAAPSHAPSALYVPQAHHSVAPPFVATYRRLGPYLLGSPVTEAYREAEVLTQDFAHLRLEWRQGHVVVGDLGTSVYPYEHLGEVSRVPARPNTPTQRYFAQTRQLLQGDFLQFWQTHGGLATFDAPISGIQHEDNGDGSGRVYAVQWFQKARLERHPETHHPRFAILLGLLGRESVYVRGWLPPRHHRGRYEQGIYW
jgi:hypothetical protein